MRIAFANSARIWGGGEVVTATLLEGLRARGHDVLLLCRRDSAIFPRLSPHVPCEPVLGGFDMNPVSVARSMFALKSARSEILVTITPRDPRTPGVAARLLGVPVVLRQPVNAGFRAKLRHRFFYEKVPAHYVANSRATRSAMLESAPWLDAARVSVVHNGVDVAQFAAGTRADLNVPAGAIVVGFVGRLETPKGIREMMQAWPVIAAEIPNAHLVVIGEGGNFEGAFTAWAMRQERVHVAGPRRDMPAVMAAIDVLAMPSYSEGFGLAVVEAMAAGVPVVASNAGALPELLDDGVEGRLVPPRDADALASAIIEIVRNAALRKSMGEAGRARARRDFDVSRMIGDYERLFTKIIGERASGSR